MQRTERDGLIFNVVRGAFTTVIFTLILVFVFALVIKFTGINQGVIKGVNQFIKIVSIFIGCVFSIKGGNGLCKGGLIGGLSALLTYFIFALIIGQMNFNLSLTLDVIFSIVIGGISGIITANVKG